MNKFGCVLKGLRTENKLTQQELADKLGISFSTISMYERGEREPGLEILEAIADYFNVDMNYLLGKSYIRNSYLVKKKGEHSKLIDAYAQSDEDTPCRTYPIIGEVAAGFGAEATEEETGDYEQIPLEWMRGYSPKDFFVLRVKGNSMYPRYMDGDRVLVLRTRSVDSGAVAVVIYDGDQGTLKKVVYNGNEGYIDLIPYNPEYSPKRIAGEDIGNLLICGEVKRLIRIVK